MRIDPAEGWWRSLRWPVSVPGHTDARMIAIIAGKTIL